MLNALKYGVRKVHDGAFTIIAGDLCDDLSILPKMYKEYLAGASVVSSCRYMEGSYHLNGPFLKRELPCLAGKILYKCGIGTRDPTNNFKIYDGKFVKGLTIQSRGGFELGLELTAKAALAGKKIRDVCGGWCEREEGASKFKLFRWLPHYAYWFFYFLLHKMRKKFSP